VAAPEAIHRCRSVPSASRSRPGTPARSLYLVLVDEPPACWVPMAPYLGDDYADKAVADGSHIVTAAQARWG